MKKIAVGFLAFVFLGFCGCVSMAPARIWIDARFNADETVAIRSAMDEWERATKQKIFDFRGKSYDDEFTFGDLADGSPVIYKVVTPNVASRALENMTKFLTKNKNGLQGYGFSSGDILIYWYNIFPSKRGLNATEHPRSLYFLQYLTMHELGHFLWLPHNNDRNSIMCLRSKFRHPEPLRLSSRDVEDFYRIHGFRSFDGR